MDHSFVVGRGTVVSWRASENFRAKRGPIPKLRGKGGSCKYTHVLVCVCVWGGGGGGALKMFEGKLGRDMQCYLKIIYNLPPSPHPTHEM